MTHAAIFDLDGTLLDTEPVYHELEGAIVREHGGGDIAEVTARLLGTTTRVSAQIVVDHFELEVSVEQYLAELDRRIWGAMEGVPLLPGVDRLVRHLHEHGVPMAVATSSSRPMLEHKVRQHRELFDKIPVLVCADDVTNSKPDPEIFLLAARKLRRAAEFCVVFEDAPAGVEAAKRAGMACVALRNAHTGDDLYRRADLILDGLHDFAPQWQRRFPAFCDLRTGATPAPPLAATLNR